MQIGSMKERGGNTVIHAVPGRESNRKIAARLKQEAPGISVLIITSERRRDHLLRGGAALRVPSMSYQEKSFRTFGANQAAGACHGYPTGGRLLIGAISRPSGRIPAPYAIDLPELFQSEIELEKKLDFRRWITQIQEENTPGALKQIHRLIPEAQGYRSSPPTERALCRPEDENIHGLAVGDIVVRDRHAHRMKIVSVAARQALDNGDIGGVNKGIRVTARYVTGASFAWTDSLLRQKCGFLLHSRVQYTLGTTLFLRSRRSSQIQSYAGR